jgi:sterol desaturase/sphingolipid hydroxylase (fatty acid hydroxylase superfamily)
MPFSSMFLLDVARLAVWLTLLSAIFVPLEHFFAARPSRVLRKQFYTDLGYYFLNSLVVALFLSVPVALASNYAHRVISPVYYAHVALIPGWLRFVLALLVAETSFYWSHRWSHEIPILWRFHSVHHSAEHMDFLVNTRAHLFDILFTRLAGLVPIYVLGLAGPSQSGGQTIPLLIGVVQIFWGFFIHANLRWRLGPLEHVVSTPAFHHWHHTRGEHIDRNYAPTLAFLDRLFGTWYLPGHLPSEYGIQQSYPQSMMGQVVQPFLRRQR